MSKTGELALLTSCADSVEAGALSARLEAEGIPTVVQGGQHASMMGPVFGAFVDVRLLVPADALERAQELLDAWENGVADETPAIPEKVEEGQARCSEHGAPSVGTCSRCGAFVCAICVPGAVEPFLCPSCDERLAREAPPRAKPRRKLVVWILLAIFAVPPAVSLIVLVLALVLEAFRALF